MCNASFQLRPANLYFIIIYIIGKNNNLVYLGFATQQSNAAGLVRCVTPSAVVWPILPNALEDLEVPGDQDVARAIIK